VNWAQDQSGSPGATKHLREHRDTPIAQPPDATTSRGWVSAPGSASSPPGPTGCSAATTGPARPKPVPVRIDGGPWRETDLTTQVNLDTWRQWRTTWQATPGMHQIEVRAADGNGNLQPQARTPVFPSGATGWELVVVTVTT
jgi:hypothetical protein